MRKNYFLNFAFSAAITLAGGAAARVPFTVDAPGKTVLFFDEAHGNQVEFYDQDGRAFLWYPGNAKVVPGFWEIQDEKICFLYGPDNLNPVTGKRGGKWYCSTIARWGDHIVDSVAGDVFKLSVSGLPFKLPAKPQYESIKQMKSLTE